MQAGWLLHQLRLPARSTIRLSVVTAELQLRSGSLGSTAMLNLRTAAVL